MARLTLERSYGFSASHLYRRPDWSEEENLRRFGRCANLPGHGHNYRLTVWLTGTVDPETGFLIDLAVLDETVRREVLDRVDHQHLNAALPEFAPGGDIPTGENLVAWIADRLVAGLASRSEAQLERVRLAEDENLAAEWLST
ncbi:MAG: 6-carboxytetrahydropterin synthase [Thermoanaerobaculia bacterium]